jgi:hypothetical protein
LRRREEKRLWCALAAYAALAVLAYLLLEYPFRAAIWIFLGGLAALTVARARYGQE